MRRRDPPAELGVEIGQTERAARLARLVQHVVGALGLQAGEDFGG